MQLGSDLTIFETFMLTCTPVLPLVLNIRVPFVFLKWSLVFVAHENYWKIHRWYALDQGGS